MAIKFSNNASAVLASSISGVTTSISVQTGQGAQFPTLASDYFFATLVDSSNNLEIVKVTARTGDVMTVVRAQEGTTARSYSAGDKFELRPTAQALTDISTGVNYVPPAASTSQAGDVQLNNTTNSTSTTQAATANAVKTAFDLATTANTTANTANTTANAAMPKSGGLFTGNVEGPYFYARGVTNGYAYESRDNLSQQWVTYVSTDAWRVYSPAGDRFTVSTSGNAFLVGTLTQNSDASFKSNWRPVEFSIDDLAGVLSGVYDRTDIDATQVGVSAQELQAILPEAVVTGDNGKLAVAYGNAALVACIELAKEVVALRARLEALEAANGT